METESPDNTRGGCGLFGAVFGRRSFWSKRTTSANSLPSVNNNIAKSPSKRRRSSFHGGTILGSMVNPSEPPGQPKAHYQPNTNKTPPQYQQNYQHDGRKAPDKARTQNFAYVNEGRRVKKSIGISGELESIIPDYQKSKGNANLVRASSGNVMLLENLGNLRQSGTREANSPKNLKPNENYPNIGMGNVVKKSPAEEPASLCRAISTRMDPETLKIMGNEDYKSGNFAEALALYEAAIAIDPNKASYRSNKSAALTALGRFLEAVFECKEAIRIDRHYHRAHHRLANLHLRLGEVEKAIYHYKQAGQEADREDIDKAKAIQAHLDKCTEAKRLRDWNNLIKATWGAINTGADSAPQIYALQAEALLKLYRQQEANEAMALLRNPNFGLDDCTKFFGPIGNANLLMVRAQVDLAMGRFDDAIAAIERAARLDSNNREASVVLRRVRGVAVARSNGNVLFKASKFSEACNAYGEGLDHDPCNSVLLCNRAACRSKLGHYEKAVEDCTMALNLRPGYSKARLRRADCYAKLGKLESSVQDYEILQREMPDDEEVNQALSEARLQLKN